MTIYGNILKAENGREFTGFAYDGKNLKTGDVYSLLRVDNPFYGYVIPITPEKFKKALTSLDLEIDYEEVRFSHSDEKPAKKYLKTEYPVTYEMTNTGYNIGECMPEIEELEQYSIDEIFKYYNSYLNPSESYLDWDDEWEFYTPIENRMTLELQMILNGNYEGGDEETALWNVEYVEKCLKDSWYHPEFDRLINDLFYDTIENYIDEEKLEQLVEKYKPEYLK